MIQIQGIVEIFFSLFFWFERDDYINVDVRKNIPLNEIELDNKDINNRLSYGSRSFNSPSKARLSRKIDPRIDSIETSNLGRYFFQAKTVLTTPLYVSITLSSISQNVCKCQGLTLLVFWHTLYRL